MRFSQTIIKAKETKARSERKFLVTKFCQPLASALLFQVKQATVIQEPRIQTIVLVANFSLMPVVVCEKQSDYEKKKFPSGGTLSLELMGGTETRRRPARPPRGQYANTSSNAYGMILSLS